MSSRCFRNSNDDSCYPCSMIPTQHTILSSRAEKPLGKVTPARELLGRMASVSGQLWSSFADSNEQRFKELLSTEPPPTTLRPLLTVPGGTAHGGLALSWEVMVMSPCPHGGDSNRGKQWEGSLTTPTPLSAASRRGAYGVPGLGFHDPQAAPGGKAGQCRVDGRGLALGTPSLAPHPQPSPSFLGVLGHLFLTCLCFGEEMGEGR